MLRLFALPLLTSAAPADPWGPVADQLKGWLFTENFGVTVGDSSGRLFEYTHGNFTLDTVVGTVSAYCVNHAFKKTLVYYRPTPRPVPPSGPLR